MQPVPFCAPQHLDRAGKQALLTLEPPSRRALEVFIERIEEHEIRRTPLENVREQYFEIRPVWVLQELRHTVAVVALVHKFVHLPVSRYRGQKVPQKPSIVRRCE